MLESLIKSYTRQKLLIKFFVNIANTGYLNQLADEFDESTNSVRKELNNLTEANYLLKESVKNRVIYRANRNHPLFNEIQKIVKKYLGIEDVIEQVLKRLGSVNEIYLLGDYAMGINSNQIDILITGKDFNINYMMGLEKKLETILKKKIVIVCSSNSDIKLNKLLIFSS